MESEFSVQLIDSNNAQSAADLLVSVFNAREPLANVNTTEPNEFAG